MSIPSTNYNNISSYKVTGKDICSSQEEKDRYDRVKKGVQEYFTQENPFGKLFAKINPTRRFCCTYDEKEIYLGWAVHRHLESQIEARGFKASVRMDSDSRYSGSSIEVAISDDDKDESGYVSEGWDESFRNSIVRPRVLENRRNTYVAMAKKIEDTLRNNPKIYKHEFSTKELEGVVVDWVMEDLEKRGFDCKWRWDKDDLTISKPFSSSFLIQESTAIPGKAINLAIGSRLEIVALPGNDQWSTSSSEPGKLKSILKKSTLNS